MNFKPVFYLLGRLLCLIGALMTVPAIVSAFTDELETLTAFLIPAGSTFVLGLWLVFLLRRSRQQGIRVRDGFLLVTLAWLSVSFIGAFPFYLSNTLPSFIDALFESTSGFTTTGATVFSDVESLPRGIVLWRGFSQWIGGMGIIVLAVAILPQLSVGGMQLLRNELPGPTFEQLKPRMKQTALSLWKIYVLFSVALGVMLYLLGMPIFETVCHVFGTVSTGGFSPMNDSIGAYGNAVQFTIAFFMLLAGTNFVLHFAWLSGRFRKVVNDPEFLFFIVLIAVSVVAIMANLAFQNGRSLFESFRITFFQVASLITSTGYTTDDFDAWPYLSKGILFLLMLIGGCAGSTGGGMKQIRLLLLLKQAKQAIYQHIYPKAVVPVKLQRRVVPEDVLRGVSSSVLIYLVVFSICTLILLTFNFDFTTATSAVVACISNMGPGFAEVGATKNYAFFPPTVKLVLSFCMIGGRLELFTILVLFIPATWRR